MNYFYFYWYAGRVASAREKIDAVQQVWRGKEEEEEERKWQEEEKKKGKQRCRHEQPPQTYKNKTLILRVLRGGGGRWMHVFFIKILTKI